MRCILTLTTSVDGNKSKATRSAELNSSSTNAELRYSEGTGVSVLRFFEDCVEILRDGDYGLRLCLRENETTKGALLLGGASGDIETYTHKIRVQKGNENFFALLEYDLIISGERQQMRVLLQTKTIKNEGNYAN